MDVGMEAGVGRGGGGILSRLPQGGGRQGAGEARPPGGAPHQHHGGPPAAGPVPADLSGRGNLPFGSRLLPDVPRGPWDRFPPLRGRGRKTLEVHSRERFRPASNGRYLLGVPCRERIGTRRGGLRRVPSPPSRRRGGFGLHRVPPEGAGGAGRPSPGCGEGVRLMPQDAWDRRGGGKDGRAVHRLPSRHPEHPEDTACNAGVRLL